MLQHLIELVQRGLKNYQRVVIRLHRWHDEHFKQTKLAISGIIIGIMALLLIGTKLVPAKSKFPDTQIGDAQDFGTDSNASITLTSRKYNSKQHFMVMKFKVKSESGTTIDPSLVKLKAVTLVQQPATYTVTPLANDHFVVVLDNLKPGYKAVQVKAKYRQADVSHLQDDVNGDETSNSSDEADDGSATKKTAKIIVNEDRDFIDNKMQKKTQQQYAIDSLNASIHQLNKRINQAKKLHKAYNDQINADNRTINNLQSNAQYQADKSSVQEKISEQQSDIVTQQGNLKELDNKTSKMKQQRRLYRKQIHDIENGTYKFEAKSTTGQLK